MDKKSVDHFFTSEKAVVDAYYDEDRRMTTFRVSADTGRIAPTGFEETMTFEISAPHYNAWTGNSGLPSFVARNEVDPVDAVEDIEDEDDRFLAESIYRFLAEHPVQSVTGHSLTNLIRSLGWVPGESLAALEVENEDLHRQVENHRQAIDEMSAQFVVEPPPPITEDDPEWDDRDDLDKYIDTPSIYEELLDDLLDEPEDEEFDTIIEKNMDGTVEVIHTIPRRKLSFDDDALNKIRDKMADQSDRIEAMIERDQRKKDRLFQARREARGQLDQLKKPRSWWQGF